MAGAERAVVDPGESLVHEDELMLGPITQREVALLGEDLAGRRRLRAVGHLFWRDDRLVAIPEQPLTLDKKCRTCSREVGAVHEGDGTPVGPR